MAGSGLANRLYRGEAGLDIVGRRKMWFTIAAAAVLISIGSFVLNGFHLGIEFAGGNKIKVPASVGTLQEARESVEKVVGTLPPDAESRPIEVATAQQVGADRTGTYEIRTNA